AKLTIANRDFITVFIDRDKRNFSLSDLYYDTGRVETRGLDIDVDSDRSRPNMKRLRIKTDKVADKHRFVKDHFLYSDRHKTIMPRMPHRLDAAGNVDVAHDHPAKNRPMR